MANDKFFNGPSYTAVIDEDPQFIRVDTQFSQIGARASVVNKINEPKGSTPIKHIGNE
jgi:hypothetical protein